MTTDHPAKKSTVPRIVQAHIQNCVLSALFEQYQRRSENCKVRLVGVVLGKVSPVSDNLLDPSNDLVPTIINCFTVPHSEFKDDININREFYHSRMELHRKVYRKDVLLGWYTIRSRSLKSQNEIGQNFERNGKFIADFFGKQCFESGAPMALHLEMIINDDPSYVPNDGESDIEYRLWGHSSDGSIVSIPHELVESLPEMITMDAIKAAITSDSYAVDNESGQISIKVQDLQKAYHEMTTRDLTEKLALLDKIADKSSDADNEAIQKIRKIKEQSEIDPRQREELKELQILLENIKSQVIESEKVFANASPL